MRRFSLEIGFIASFGLIAALGGYFFAKCLQGWGSPLRWFWSSDAIFIGVLMVLVGALSIVRDLRRVP